MDVIQDILKIFYQKELVYRGGCERHGGARHDIFVRTDDQTITKISFRKEWVDLFKVFNSICVDAVKGHQKVRDSEIRKKQIAEINSKVDLGNYD